VGLHGRDGNAGDVESFINTVQYISSQYCKNEENYCARTAGNVLGKLIQNASVQDKISRG
jgi:hypothetical protein